MVDPEILQATVPLRLDDKAIRAALNARSRQNIAQLAIAECPELTDNDEEYEDVDMEEPEADAEAEAAQKIREDDHIP